MLCVAFETYSILYTRIQSLSIINKPMLTFVHSESPTWPPVGLCTLNMCQYVFGEERRNILSSIYDNYQHKFHEKRKHIPPATKTLPSLNLFTMRMLALKRKDVECMSTGLDKTQTHRKSLDHRTLLKVTSSGITDAMTSKISSSLWATFGTSISLPKSINCQPSSPTSSVGRKEALRSYGDTYSAGKMPTYPRTWNTPNRCQCFNTELVVHFHRREKQRHIPLCQEKDSLNEYHPWWRRHS